MEVPDPLPQTRSAKPMKDNLQPSRSATTPMRRTVAVLLLVTVTTLAGCGNSSKSATPDPSTKAANSLTSVLETNSTGQVGFTHGQASCVSKGFVEQFGVDGLQKMGLLDEKLEPGHPSGGFKLSPVDASGAADATLACVNASDFITHLMNSGGTSGGLDEATMNCIADTLGDTRIHDLLVAAFEGNQSSLKGVLMPAALSCAMG
jgi:hypothetical protein